MFDYDFMRYAFIAGIFIALISCVMGVFVVARQTSFFTHTLSEIGFSGAAIWSFCRYFSIDRDANIYDDICYFCRIIWRKGR